MSYRIIVLFRAPDGEHVGNLVVNEAPNKVTAQQDETFVKKAFEQREHIHVTSWWREKGPNDLADTIASIEKKYPDRPSLAERTGNQPTRSLVDPTAFETDDAKDD